MSPPPLRMAVHLDEASRTPDGGVASAALMDLLERAGLTSVLVRGMGGFGHRRRPRTDMLLTSSEDLPLVIVAVGADPAIRRVAAEVAGLLDGGLITLDRVGLDAPLGEGTPEVAVTVVSARGDAHAVVEGMRDAGLWSAVALPGVDGVTDGRRRRARLLVPGWDVPAIVTGAGPRGVLAAARDGLHRRGLSLIVEAVHVLRRPGVPAAEPPPVPGEDAPGLGIRVRIGVLCGEDDRLDGGPLHSTLAGRLHEARASGVTVLRGMAGFTGPGHTHADRPLGLRRRAPVLLQTVDLPARARSLWPIIREATEGAGVVTWERVPAARITTGGRVRGGLDPVDPT